MASSQMQPVIQQLCKTALLRDRIGLSDAQLLECFIANREEAAFEALVRRHGPMVLGVCRRLLRCSHDADDAFQATFLVLVRKAASIVPRELLPNWLYGVAYRTAVRARSLAARRQQREKQVTEMADAKEGRPSPWEELRPLLDQELSRLADKYRVAIVLCDLEGKTRKAAAQQLGVPEGTLSTRLARGRILLARRLARHGRLLSGGVLAALLAERAASGMVPLSLVVATVKAASSFAAGNTAAASTASAQATALTEGVLQAMLLTKLKRVAAVLLLLCVIASATGLLQFHTAAGQQAQAHQEGVQEANRPADPSSKVARVPGPDVNAGQTDKSPSAASAPQEKKTGGQDTKTKDKVPTLSSYAIAKVYCENAAKADKHLLGVRVAVSGPLLRIQRLGEGDKTSYLLIMSASVAGGVEAIDMPLTFQFDKEARDELALLRVPDYVHIEGECQGPTEMPPGKETILFRKCKVVPSKN
jgi:RNA polymerase sigma factor (sigma-70 family)